MIPKKTELCWAIRSAEKASPQRSIASLARSPKSMLRARRYIGDGGPGESHLNESCVNGKSNGPDIVRAVVTKT